MPARRTLSLVVRVRFPAAIELSTLDGTNGFRLIGIDPYDNSGKAVSSAGDVNGDGYARHPDRGLGCRSQWQSFGRGLCRLRIGEHVFPPPSNSAHSMAPMASVSMASTPMTFSGGRWTPPATSTGMATTISWSERTKVRVMPERTYVIFGSASTFPAAVDLSTLDGTNGFRLDGVDAGDNSGKSVSTAGDVKRRWLRRHAGRSLQRRSGW